MSGVVSGRELECRYSTWIDITFWPSNTYCEVDEIDFSAKFEKEKHSFTGSASEKSEVKTFEIRSAEKLDFIPLEIVDEFPNLSGLVIRFCGFRTVKAGLFRVELKRIEYVWLESNDVEVIEPKAFEHLTKLKWIGLNLNKIQTLSYKFFENNPRLVIIRFHNNQIDSIHPDFFDGLEELKMVQFRHNICIDKDFGCTTCQITQADLKKELGYCYENCAEGTICHNSYLDPKVLHIEETEKVVQENEDQDEEDQ
jgi:hypothetical protein